MNRWRDTIIRLSTTSDSINDAVLYTLLKRVGYSVVPSGSANGPIGAFSWTNENIKSVFKTEDGKTLKLATFKVLDSSRNYGGAIDILIPCLITEVLIRRWGWKASVLNIAKEMAIATDRSIAWNILTELWNLNLKRLFDFDHSNCGVWKLFTLTYLVFQTFVQNIQNLTSKGKNGCSRRSNNLSNLLYVLYLNL